MPFETLNVRRLAGQSIRDREHAEIFVFSFTPSRSPNVQRPTSNAVQYRMQKGGEEGKHYQALRYASRKSDRRIPDCEQIVRRVDAFRVEWFGIVSGVRLPSGFCRTIEICSRSRMSSNPSALSARRTFVFGASTGNFIPW